MLSFSKYVEKIKVADKSRFALPENFDPVIAHTVNQANKSILKILHASLEYGQTGKSDSASVGGLGSFVFSLSCAQKLQPELDARIILPKYQFIAWDLDFFSLTVPHYFKGSIVETSILKSTTKNGVIVYLVSAASGFETLFSDVTQPSQIYQNINNSSLYMDRVSYFNGVVTAFAMLGDSFDSNFLPHIVHGHGSGGYFIGKLMQKYRSLYHCESKESCTPYTVFTVHTNHDSERKNESASIADIGLSIEQAADTSTLVINNYDRLVYVSASQLKQSIMSTANYSTGIAEKYINGNAWAILNGINADDFDPAQYLDSNFCFNADNIVDSKLKIKQFLNTNFFSKRGKILSLDTPTVLFVGRFVLEKGVEDLAQAARLLLSNSCSFICMGHGYSEEVATFAYSFANKANVIVLDSLQEQEEWGWLIRAAADIYLVPSRVEPCGLVSMEANLAGALVLSSSAGGLSDIVIDGANGLKFKHSIDMLNKIELMLAVWRGLKNTGNLNMTLKLVQESARKTFDWHAPRVGAANEYKKLYRGVFDALDQLCDFELQQTRLILAIIRDEHTEVDELLEDPINLLRANSIGLLPIEIAIRLNKPDLIRKFQLVIQDIQPDLLTHEHKTNFQNSKDILQSIKAMIRPPTPSF